MDYLSVCAIIKDENSYLPEWMEWHRMMGVERFYLYDNDCRIPIADTLRPEIDAGLVVAQKCGGRGLQRMVYEQCVQERAGESFWIAFIDIDEFMVADQGDLRSLLSDYEAHSGVGLNWRCFGSSGLERRPEGLQTEHFKMRTPDVWWGNEHVKTIARPEKVASFLGPHHCEYSEGYAVDTAGRPLTSSFAKPPAFGKGHINHYVIRSRAEFEDKLERGGGDGVRKKPSFFGMVDQECTVKDEGMSRHAATLRRAIEARTPSWIGRPGMA